MGNINFVSWLIVYTLIGTGNLLGSIANAEENELKGLKHILNCSDCHGFDGNSTNPKWPNLAGMHPTYLVKQLMDFKYGHRSNHEMDDVVKNIPSDSVIEEMAEYFYAQNLLPIKSTKKMHSSLVDLNLGKEIFDGKRIEYGIPACSACHGEDGLGGKEGKYPRLAGQHRQYIIRQMKLFRSRERKNDVPAMMQNIARVMDDEDIESVAAYIELLSVTKIDQLK